MSNHFFFGADMNAFENHIAQISEILLQTC